MRANRCTNRGEGVGVWAKSHRWQCDPAAACRNARLATEFQPRSPLETAHQRPMIAYRLSTSDRSWTEQPSKQPKYRPMSRIMPSSPRMQAHISPSKPSSIMSVHFEGLDRPHSCWPEGVRCRFEGFQDIDPDKYPAIVSGYRALTDDGGPIRTSKCMVMPKTLAFKRVALPVSP